LNEATLSGLTATEATKFHKQLQIVYKNIQNLSQS